MDRLPISRAGNFVNTTRLPKLIYIKSLQRGASLLTLFVFQQSIESKSYDRLVTFLPTKLKRAVLFLFSLLVSFDWANLPSHTMDIKQLNNAFVNKLCKRGSLAFSTIQKSAFHCQILPVFSAARETTLINLCLPSSSSYVPFHGSYSSPLGNV